MDIASIVFYLGLGLIILGITFVFYASSFFEAHQVSQRLQKYVVEGNNTESNRGTTLWERNFSESFLNRTILRFINSLINFLGRYTPSTTIQDINRQLTLAGNNNLRAQQYYAIRLLFLISGVLGAVLYYNSVNTINALLTGGAFILIMFILPILWLRMSVSKRQKEIQITMPDALDMLSVSTAAGLGFDQALLKVSQFYKTAAGDEFGRVVSEMEVGLSRQEALRNFAERVDLSEVSSFVAVVIQSEILGMSIADVLHSQAEQMRIQRQYRAKEAAQRLPVKMMIPLALLILPALIAVLLGPAIPVLLDLF